MTREEVYKHLNEVFQDVFDDENIIVNNQTTLYDVEDWNSLENIKLIVAVETKFGIKFSMEDILGFSKVGDMVDIIQSKI